MKKCMLIVLIMVFAVVSFGALCFAQSPITVANTSKKGSLLIFPLVKVGPNEVQDTIITISNDYTSKVNMQCVYRTPKACACAPFDFSLTANQSISFSVKNGKGLDGSIFVTSKLPKVQVAAFPKNGQLAGELKCWAVDGDDAPMSFNYLSGDAIIREAINESWEYSAWRFSVGYEVTTGVRVPNSVTGDIGSQIGTLRLTGTPQTYDACPRNVIYNIIEQATDPSAVAYQPGDTGGYRRVDNRMTLIPCKQDCVGNTNTVVRADMSRRNEYETSGHAYACLDCSDNTTAFF